MADGRHFENRKIAICQWKIVRFRWILYTIANGEPDRSHVTKIEIFEIQDGGDSHLENRFRGHNSSTIFLISAKFCSKKQNGMPTKVTWQILQIFKIQDGGRPLLWKSLNHHISVKILSDFDKIWCTTAYIKPDDIFKSAIAVSYKW